MDDARKTKAALIAELRRLRLKAKKLESPSWQRSTPGKEPPKITRKKVSRRTPSSADWHERYRVIFENSGTGIIIVDKEGKYLLANKISAAAFGKSPEEVIGKFMSDLMPRETSERYLDLNRQLIESGGNREYEDTFQLPTGPRSFLIIDQCLYDADGKAFAVQSSSIDITERKSAEFALRASEEKFRAISDFTADVEAWFGMDGRLLWINQSVERVMGYTPAECLSMDRFPLPIIYHEDVAKVSEELGGARRGEHGENAEFRFVRKDGEVRWGSVAWQPISNQRGEPLGHRSSVRDITSRKVAEEELRASKDRYQHLVENMNDVVMEVDEHGRLCYVSPNYPSLSGYSAEEEINSSAIEHVHPDDQPLVLQALHRVFDSEALKLCYRVRQKSGEWLWVETSARLYCTGDGNRRVISVARDITERKRAEEKLQKSEEKYRELYLNASLGIFHSTPEGRFIDMNPTLARFLGYDSPEEAVNSISDIAEQVFAEPPRRDAVANAALRAGGILTTDNVYLRRDGTTWHGRLNLRVVPDEGGSSSHYEGFVEDITEQKRGEEALERERTLLSAVINTFTDEICLKDPEGRFLFANEASAKALGASNRDELIGKTDFDYMSSAWAEGYRAEEEEILASGNAVIDRELVAIDPETGELRRGVSNSKLTVKTPTGEILGVLSVNRDITERIRAEKALRESEERFRVITSSTPDHIIVQDCDLRYQFVLHPQLGLKESDMIGKTDRDILQPEEAEHLTAIKKRVLETGISFHLETSLRIATGEIDWFDGTLIPKHDSAGMIDGVIGYFRNVTKSKQAEQSLLEAKAYAEKLIHTANAMIVGLDVAGNVVLFNEEAEKITGYSHRDLEGKNWFEVLVPKDRYPEVWEKFQEVAAGGIMKEFENPILTKSGEERIISWQNTELRKEGTITGTISFGVDITERKKAEAKIKYQANLLANVPDAVLATDRDFKIQYWNAAAERKYGWTFSEVEGVHFTKFIQPQYIGDSRRIVMRAISQIGHWRGELLHNRRDGTLFPVLVTISEVRNEDGEIVGHVAVNRDITDLKRAERLVEDERNLLRSIINAIPDEIVVKDLGRKFVLANESCLRALGKDSMTQVLGLRDEDLIPWRFATQARFKENQVLFSGETLVNDMPEPRRNPQTGEVERALMSTKTPLRDRSGEPTGLVVVNRDVTELRRVQEHLSKSEERFRDIIFSLADWVWEVDKNGVYTYSSDKGFELFGPSRENVIGRTPFDLMPPDEAARVGAIFSEIAAKKAPIRDLENWNITKDGKRICLLTNGVPILDEAGNLKGYRGVHKDITNRKRSEDALRVSEERFRALAESALVGVYILQDGKYSYVNPAMARVFGYSVAEMTGMTPREIVYQGDHGMVDENIRRRIAGEVPSLQYQVRGRHKDGSTLNVEVFGSTVDMLGTPALLGTLIDITERKRAQDQLLGSQQQLHQLAGHLQSVREEERKHLAQEFHDQLGQTLTAIKMDLSMLHRASADPAKPLSRSAIAQGIDSAQDMIDRAIAIIREILSELRPEILDQLGVVATLEWEAERFQQHSGISCAFRTTIETIALDAKKSIALYRIFQEAVTNVARHANATQVEVTLRTDEESLVLEIKDNGVGISVEAQQKSDSFGLIGIRERTLLLGGSLEIGTGEAGGTTILVRIPYAQPFNK